MSDVRKGLLGNVNGFKIKPNVVAQWLSNLRHVRDLPGLNISPGTGYSNVFLGFPQSFLINAGIVTLIRPQPPPSLLVSFIIHHRPIIRR